MAIIKANDIMEMYNGIIKRMMEIGNEVYPWTMSGHQGEIARVDLYNKDEGIFRVWLTKDSKSVGKHQWTEVVEIFVERFDEPEADQFASFGRTLWYGKGEEVYRKAFYEIGERRRRKAFTDSLDEFLSCRAISDKRITERYNTSPRRLNLTASRAMDVAAIVREHKGYTRVKGKDIREVVRTGNRYVVRFVDNKKKELFIG